MEDFETTEYTLNHDNYAEIEIPSDWKQGYYMLNDAGLFRYVDAPASKGISSTEFNEKYYAYDDDGNLIYDDNKEPMSKAAYDEEQQQLSMYGFISNNHNTVSVSNRIFEMLLYTHFVGESDKDEDLRQFAAANKSIFVDEDGWLDVRKIMEHFIIEHNRIHGEDNEKFVEDEGRERFLTYLAPIINGTGTYSIEEQTRTHKRMDVVIHYLGQRYIVELKIWHGKRYHEDGEKQIMEYLDRFGLNTGYMISFNFNQNKKPGVERLNIGDKVLFEATV